MLERQRVPHRGNAEQRDNTTLQRGSCILLGRSSDSVPEAGVGARR